MSRERRRTNGVNTTIALAFCFETISESHQKVGEPKRSKAVFLSLGDRVGVSRRLTWLDFVGQRIVEAAVQKKSPTNMHGGGPLSVLLTHQPSCIRGNSIRRVQK